MRRRCDPSEAYGLSAVLETVVTVVIAVAGHPGLALIPAALAVGFLLLAVTS